MTSVDLSFPLLPPVPAPGDGAAVLALPSLQPPSNGECLSQLTLRSGGGHGEERVKSKPQL